MTEPFARPLAEPAKTGPEARPSPKAFLPAEVRIEEHEPDFDVAAADPDQSDPRLRRMGWPARLAWGAGGLFLSLALGLFADSVINDLFARYSWLGWAGVALLAAFVVAVLAVIVREFWAVRRLKTLDRLRRDAAETLLSDRRADGHRIETALQHLYASRPDMARARAELATQATEIFDGGEIVRRARPPASQVQGVARPDIGEYVSDGRRHERMTAGRGFEQHQRERPDVGALIRGASIDDIGRQIKRRACEGRGERGGRSRIKGQALSAVAPIASGRHEVH